jgi:putative PIN family toxin of toxin-antitoxin system
MHAVGHYGTLKEIRSGMATQNNLYVPDDLLAQARRRAESQGRTADELAAEALQRYLAHEILNELSGGAEERRTQLGIGSDEEVEIYVDRIIHEHRQEKRGRWLQLDANVYISALQFGGGPERLLRRAIEGDIQVAISEPILTEVLRILRDEFGRSQAELAKFEMLIRGCTRLVTAKETLNVIAEDPDDDRILECAVTSGSDVIVTGDRDLLRLGAYKGIAVLKVSDFLARAKG